MNRIHFGDNLDFLKNLTDTSIDMIYVDPPFCTQKTQKRTQIKTVEDEAGDRVGFSGTVYRTETVGTTEFEDKFDDFIGFLRPRMQEALRVLKPTGSLFFHIDFREVHYCKVMLDQIFGRKSFISEIIWSFDYGARSKTKWPAKHNNILWYAKDPNDYCYNYKDMDRIPYKAPGLVGPEKAARGKTCTDVWEMTIVPTNSKEKTGYATQKPLHLLRRIVKIHSNPGDLLLDFFCGSGSLGDVANELGREFIMCDSNPQAITVMKKRFQTLGPDKLIWS